jgi:hypothetical protein
MSGLFLSYSRADRALAERIVHAMRAVGVAAWWDEDMSAVDWQMELAERIHELSGVLVIWTEESVKSVHVRDEARLALQTDKLVNVMAGVPSPPFPFDRINGFHLDDWTGREPHRGWTRVVAAVEELEVQKGGAKPGEITVALALREDTLRERQKAVAQAQASLQRLQAREVEAGEAKALADATAEKAQDQLQRVAEMRAAPAILRAAQQEFDAAFEAREEAAATLQKTRREFERASSALAAAMDALETMLSSPDPLAKAHPAPPPRPKPRAETPRPGPETTPRPAPPAPPPSPPRREAAKAARPRRTAPHAAATVEAAPAGGSLQTAPPPAAVAAAPRSARPVGRRPLIAAGVGLGLALAAGALFLLIRPPSASASHPTASVPGAAALDPATASAAAALAGKWAIQGLDCSDPITVSVSGDQLSMASSGAAPTTLTIEPGVVNGTVRARGPDGESSYTLSRSDLAMSTPGAPPTQMTRCKG